MKYALAVAVMMAALPMVKHAAAGSGSMVVNIESNNPNNPDCVTFVTQNDAQRYGTSLNDPGATQTLITLNNARGYPPGVFFSIGNPGAPFHAADCANGVVYVTTIRR